jgi:ABC-2 type transport system permease protein
MKFANIASKGLRETFRDRRGLAFLILFPLAFMLIFGLAFGSAGNTTPRDITVINYDTGTFLLLNNSTQYVNFGTNLTGFLQTVKYENSSVNIFNLKNVSENDANDLVKSRNIDALIIIPENFSKAFASLVNYTARTEITSQVGEGVIASPTGATANSTQQIPSNQSLPRLSNVTSMLIVKGDPGYLAFGMTQSIVSGILEEYKDGVQAEVQAQIAGAGLGNATAVAPSSLVSAVSQPLAGTTSFTAFDYQAPGLVVFALLIEVTSIAGVLAGEVERGTLDRLKLSKMRSYDLFVGSTLPWTVVAAIQVVILFGVAVAIGFHWQGGPISLFYAIVIGVLAAIASIALGLLLAAFAKTEKQASNLGVLIAVPLSFLTGAFFTLPKVYIGTLFGQPFQIYDILPWTQAIYALRSILVFGTGIEAVTYNIVMIIITTTILFIVGIIAFSRTRLRAQK